MISLDKMRAVRDYVDNYGIHETMQHFGIGMTTVKRYLRLANAHLGGQEVAPGVTVHDTQGGSGRKKQKVVSIVPPVAAQDTRDQRKMFDDEPSGDGDAEALSPEEAAELAGISLAEYRVHRLDYNFRADGKKQFKVSFTPRDQSDSAWVLSDDAVAEYAQRFVEHVKTYEPPEFSDNRFQVQVSDGDDNQLAEEYFEISNRMALISIADWHHGKQIWGPEISGEDKPNWDLKISEIQFKAYMDYSLDVVNLLGVNTVYFAVNGDFFNSDNAYDTTFKGTAQSEDDRYMKTQLTAERMLVYAIAKALQTVENVEVIITPGNHDTTRLFILGQYLSAFFRNEPRVVVNAGPAPRKRIVWGKTLLGFSHEMKGNMVQLMYSLWPKECAECTDLVMNVGHLHTRKDMVTVKEYQQRVRIVQHPSMIPEDAWSDGEGFQHLQEGLTQVYDKRYGLVAEFPYRPSFNDGCELQRIQDIPGYEIKRG